MNVDIKHDLLKNFIEHQKLGQKRLETTINQSMVPGTGQKSLGMNLQNESGLKNGLPEKTDKKSKKDNCHEVLKTGQDKKGKDKDKQAKQESESLKIERNPLVLLKSF